MQNALNKKAISLEMAFIYFNSNGYAPNILKIPLKQIPVPINRIIHDMIDSIVESPVKRKNTPIIPKIIPTSNNLYIPSSFAVFMLGVL
jgi:hypothetical protein